MKRSRKAGRVQLRCTVEPATLEWLEAKAAIAGVSIGAIVDSAANVCRSGVMKYDVDELARAFSDATSGCPSEGGS